MVDKARSSDPLLDSQPIVKEDGTPTDYFLRQWALQRDVNKTTEGVIDEVTAVQAIVIIAGAGLAGGGALSGGDIQLDLEDTAVTPGSFTNANITVDQQGRLTAASSGSVSNLFIAGMFFPGKHTDNLLLMRYVFDRAVDFPNNFVGSKGSVVTDPTAGASIDIQRNGASIGTINISTSGVVTFLTAGAGVESFIIGDTLEMVAQTPADATLADTSITLNGTRI